MVHLTPGSRAGLELRSSGKSVAVQPIVSVDFQPPLRDDLPTLPEVPQVFL